MGTLTPTLLTEELSPSTPRNPGERKKDTPPPSSKKKPKNSKRLGWLPNGETIEALQVAPNSIDHSNINP